MQDHNKFSPDFIESFLRPWLSGIFLEPQFKDLSKLFPICLSDAFDRRYQLSRSWHAGASEPVSVSARPPQGKTLISISLVGEQALETYDPSAVKTQLRSWFGDQVEAWKELANYLIPHALPRQPAGFAAHRPPLDLPSGIIVCGDYCESTSLHGVLASA